VSSTIVVRRATLADAAAYARIMGDPAVYPGLLQVPHTSEDAWRQRLTESLAPGKTDLILVAELHGNVVGNAGLHPIGTHLRRRHALGLGIAVASTARRQGVGTALMAALCDFADRWAGALRLELHVYTDNAAAIALYRKFGFEIEGTHRGYALRDGVFVDSYSMARWNPNPPVPPTSTAA
jgi:putative acetyltransferase